MNTPVQRLGRCVHNYGPYRRRSDTRSKRRQHGARCIEATDRTAGGGQKVQKFAGTWKLEWMPERARWVQDEPDIKRVP